MIMLFCQVAQWRARQAAARRRRSRGSRRNNRSNNNNDNSNNDTNDNSNNDNSNTGHPSGLSMLSNYANTCFACCSLFVTREAEVSLQSSEQ